MKVLVTGGSGFVGQQVVQELLASGHTTRILARSVPCTQVQPAPNATSSQRVQGSVLDPQTLHAACAGMDAVVHLVGIISELPPNTFENVHVTGTLQVLAAAQDCGVQRFVHMSALGARANAPSRYHRTKWQAEQAVRASGLDWTIFRPSIIHGPGDAFVNLFARLSRFSPVLPVIGSGTHLLQPIPVQFVAQAFARAVEQTAACRHNFDLCGLHPVSLLQILDAILTATGRRRLKLRIPIPLARLQAATLEFVCPRLLRTAPPLNRDQILMLQEDNVGDPLPAARLFDLHLPPDPLAPLVAQLYPARRSPAPTGHHAPARFSIPLPNSRLPPLPSPLSSIPNGREGAQAAGEAGPRFMACAQVRQEQGPLHEPGRCPGPRCACGAGPGRSAGSWSHFTSKNFEVSPSLEPAEAGTPNTCLPQVTSRPIADLNLSSRFRTIRAAFRCPRFSVPSNPP